tara:strand:+ start:65077 stop:65709 length:633 start_codon:yes stop_codon:yes gene_type:complete
MSTLETVQLFLQEGADLEAAESTLRSQLSAAGSLADWYCGRNLEGCWGGGQFTVDLKWNANTEQPAMDFSSLPGFASADAVCYYTVDSGQRDPGLRQGIWRTLLLHVRKGVHATDVEAFEQELLGMPRYMAAIRNWRLARVTTPGSRWTHVWQQEYASIDGLMGEYLLHPYHWGWVDRRFDPEFPDAWIVDTGLCHVFCPLQSSIIVRTE